MADQTPSTRRTFLVLGGMTAAAALVFAVLRWGGYGAPPLPRELTAEDVSDKDRHEAARRLLGDTPAADRPGLIRRADRTSQGKAAAQAILMAVIDDDPGTA